MLIAAKNLIAQNVGIGTQTPAEKLHVVDSSGNETRLTVQSANAVSFPATLRLVAGLDPLNRFEIKKFAVGDAGSINGISANNLSLISSGSQVGALMLNVGDNSSPMHFATGGAERMRIAPNGNVGIGTLSPNNKLDIVNNNNTKAINLVHTGTGTEGIYINMGNSPNNKGIYIYSGYNYTPGTISLGLHAISGNGALGNYSPTVNYGVVGECRNPSLGGGVLGISNAPSPGIFEGGVYGTNFSAAAEAYGVVGFTSSVDGAGVVGKTSNASTGVLGYSVNASGPAIKAQCIGTSGTAIELNNGAIKVSGTERAVFQHITNGANIVGNLTIIPASTFANSATDMLVVTSVYDASNPVYITFAFQTYWNGANWCIINPTGGAMPINAKFNVLVVKQ